MAVLEVLNLNFTYTDATVPSLSGISFDLKEGESLLLCGPVGCGKSTLISCLLPNGNPRGQLGGELKFHGTSVGYVSQSSRVSVTDRVFSELSFPLENHSGSRHQRESCQHRTLQSTVYIHLQILQNFHRQNNKSLFVFHPQELSYM